MCRACWGRAAAVGLYGAASRFFSWQTNREREHAAPSFAPPRWLRVSAISKRRNCWKRATRERSEPARMPQPLALRLLVLPACHALLLPSPLPLPFPITVELLDKGGERKTVRTELPPHFSSSRVLHVRFSLPVSLHVEPHKGVMQISKDGGGLHRGDVLRAFTSVSWRSRPVFGLIPLSVQPIRSLFVADGMPANRVFEALAANREDRASDHVKQPPTAWPTRPPARPASARSSSGQPPASASLDQWADFLSAGRPWHGLAFHVALLPFTRRRVTSCSSSNGSRCAAWGAWTGCG